MDDDFGVRVRIETVPERLELGLQLDVVEYLAVEYDVDRAVFVVDRLIAATSDLRVCRLSVQNESGGRGVRGCLFNASTETRKDLGVKIRGLDAPVVSGTPVGAPPNLLVEQVLAVPGELPTQTGFAFSGRVPAEGGSPLVWEAIADRVDLLR